MKGNTCGSPPLTRHLIATAHTPPHTRLVTLPHHHHYYHHHHHHHLGLPRWLALHRRPCLRGTSRFPRFHLPREVILCDGNDIGLKGRRRRRAGGLHHHHHHQYHLEPPRWLALCWRPYSRETTRFPRLQLPRELSLRGGNYIGLEAK